MEERLLMALALPSGEATTSESRDVRSVPAHAPDAPGFALANGPGPGDDDDDDDDDDDNAGGGGGGNIDPDDDEGYDDDDDDDDEETLQVSACPAHGRIPVAGVASSHCTIPW
jgi:hypothetical protein